MWKLKHDSTPRYCSRYSRLQVTCCPRVLLLPWIPSRILPFHGLDSYEEDSSGVCSMSLIWGLSAVFSPGWTGIVGFWKEDPRSEVALLSHHIRARTFARHHGGRQPGHLAQVVSAKESCSLFGSLRSLWQPLKERQPTLLGVGAKLREDPPCSLEFHEEDGLVGVCLHSRGDPAPCCLSGYFPVPALAAHLFQPWPPGRHQPPAPCFEHFLPSSHCQPLELHFLM